jgi:hypothetical protein
MDGGKRLRTGVVLISVTVGAMLAKFERQFSCNGEKNQT